MAYMKYKELTKYFDFTKKISIDSLPKYVMQYIDAKEIIIRVYRTRKDHEIFTDKRVILFDLRWNGLIKTIYTIPYDRISTSAIVYKPRTCSLLFAMDSGYPVKLNFLNMDSKAKTNLRIMYSKYINRI